MKTKTFWDIGHANAYLAGSIVTFQGQGFFINEVVPNKNSTSYSIIGRLGNINGKSLTVKYPDKDIDLTPPKLGMFPFLIDGIGELIKVERIPSRQWKIGLTSSNIAVAPIGKEGRRASGKQTVVVSDEMFMVIENKYPSIKTTMAYISSGMIPGCGISHHFALTPGQLYYRYQIPPVGTFSSRGIELLPEFSYLRELFNKEVVV